MRSLCGLISMILTVRTSTLIPINMVYIITSLLPIFCSIFGYIVNKEKVHLIEIICFFIALIGIFIITKGYNNDES